jgi:cystathionine beta-synthase
MKYYNNILETVGNTPLVKLNKIMEGVPGLILAKVETSNPGNSVKDRMAIQMIEDAEKEGKIKPGGTLIEGTSGNTGMGLALVAIQKGYKLICTLADKQSKEKVDILRAMGAECIVTPTNVQPEDPRSYYSVSKRLAKETPNSFYVNQYDNLSNRKAHYLTTGPEIWEQTEGKITHFVVGVGTGGTVSGVGKFLKEKNPNIKIWGIDTYGSVFKKFHETGEFDENEIYPYITEGIGEDILPKNVDFSVIDHFEKVTDKNSCIYTRKLAREEGIFVGNSAGAAVSGILQLKDQLKPDDVVVVLFHDHGSRYVGKMFNDDWMREKGFLPADGMQVKDLIMSSHIPEVQTADIITPISEIVSLMIDNDFSQLPLTDNGRMIGSISQHKLFSELTKNVHLKTKPVGDIMEEALPYIDTSVNLNDLIPQFKTNNPALLVRDFNTEKTHIVTESDVLKTLV